MTFTFLMQGDALPSVTTSQLMVRRHRPNVLNKADGIYGFRTANAIREYQTTHALKRDGIIGPETWNSFQRVSGLQTIDVVDGTDSSLVALEATDIRTAGGDPIVLFGQSNGLNTAMRAILQRGQEGNVMLLRIHGHGNRGLQNITGGEINGAPHMAGIALSNYGQAEPDLLMIKRVFQKFASVQLLGCDVGGGNGKTLVQKLAKTWGVPVTAGLHTQFGGGTKTFRFEGGTTTGFPNGESLKSWSQAMENEFGNVSLQDAA